MAPSLRCWLSLLVLPGLAACTSGGGGGDGSAPPVAASNLSAAAALSEPEIQDVVAFLQTLTDGFTQ